MPNRQFGDLLSCLNQPVTLEITEAESHQLARFAGALTFGIQPVNHQNQPPPILFGRGDKPIARSLRMPRLKAVRPDIGIKQRIAIGLANIIPCEIALAEQAIIISMIVNQLARQNGQIARRGLVVRVRQSG